MCIKSFTALNSDTNNSPPAGRLNKDDLLLDSGGGALSKSTLNIDSQPTHPKPNTPPTTNKTTTQQSTQHKTPKAPAGIRAWDFLW
jgi:hypothetical protein